MLHIKCPHCGMRSQNEFSYGGDASVKRPELNKEITDEEWDNFVYNRKSLRGKHLELWQHLADVDNGLRLRETLSLTKYLIHTKLMRKFLNESKI